MDLRKCYRVRGLDEQLEHCIHVSDRNRLLKRDRWNFNNCPLPEKQQNGETLAHSAFSVDDGQWFKNPYEVGHDFLAHYGIKGQKWGVITKEYQPVAIDHRKTGNNGGLFPKTRARIRMRLDRERAERQREHQETIENWQAKRKAKQRAVKIGGSMLGIGLLGIAAYRGYKVSGIKPKETYRNALKSLTELKPTKARRGKAFSQLFTLMAAREQNQHSGLARVLQTFKRAGGIFSLTRYRQKIKKARGYIDKFKNYRVNRI